MPGILLEESPHLRDAQSPPETHMLIGPPSCTPSLSCSWGGRGRAGTVGACLLAQMYGMSADEALERQVQGSGAPAWCHTFVPMQSVSVHCSLQWVQRGMRSLQVQQGFSAQGNIYLNYMHVCLFVAVPCAAGSSAPSTPGKTVS